MDRARRTRAPSWQSRVSLLALVLFLVVWGANGRVKQFRNSAGRSAAPVALLIEKEARGGPAMVQRERPESRRLVLERGLRLAEKNDGRGRVIARRRVDEGVTGASWRWMESFSRFQRPPPRGVRQWILWAGDAESDRPSDPLWCSFDRG